MKKRLYFVYLILLVILFALYNYSDSVISKLEKDLSNINLEENIEYLNQTCKNIEKEFKSTLDINKAFSDSLEDENKRKILYKYLSILSTDKYRYIYVVEKYKKYYRFLLDVSLDDKGEFLEEFLPSNENIWDKVFKSKKSIYFKQDNIKTLWLTYLYPIVINNNVKAIIAIDFSLKEQNRILNSLSKLNKIHSMSSILIAITFIILIIVSFVEYNREEELKKINQNLKIRVEEEVEKNRQKDRHLLQQSKLAQMGEMISMIAHQWRQPLSAVNNLIISINLKLKLNMISNEEIEKTNEKIINHIQFLSETIENFRSFFKKDSQKHIISTKELIKSILSIIKHTLDQSNIKVFLDIKDSESFVFENEIKQVLLNIIQNAKDAIVSNEIKNPYIKISSYISDNYTIFGIEDNGGGINKDILDKIFEPYFSTKSKNGTGIGLYMSKIIVENHHKGKIKVDVKDNKTIFKIYIPKREISNES